MMRFARMIRLVELADSHMLKRVLHYLDMDNSLYYFYN